MPSKSPTPASSVTTRDELDAPLHIDTGRDGEHLVVRDAQGNVAYPGYIPPDVDLPYSATANTAAAKTDSPVSGPNRPSGPAITLDAPPHPVQRADTAPMSPSQTSRPALNNRIGTTAPKRRVGWSLQPHEREPYAESSDSSDSEGEAENDPADLSQPQERSTKDKLKDHGKFDRFKVGNNNYSTQGRVKRDGRLRITLEETANTGYLAKALGSAFVGRAAPKRGTDDNATKTQELSANPVQSNSSSSTIPVTNGPVIKLNIVVMVIGSRGDIQPFLKIGKVLKEEYGHRVRIATHPAFRDFVEKDCGLEFFSVGGDPAELMAFMVKNPGLIPTLETVKAGDIGRRRAAMADMFEGFWRACVNATDNETSSKNLKTLNKTSPFIADAIIANPPSFAHMHCAEALGIPLHLMFTFPYTPTQEFPHPLASIKRSNVDPGYTNFISYPLVEMMVWQGLGDLVNDFRVRTLGLDPMSTLWAPGAPFRLHVPFDYLWSPGLVAKPADWGQEIAVSGFVFLELASSFKPPKELEEFLKAGPPPIYIGFGSIVVDDPEKFTDMIFEAVEMAGVRALVSKGWGGLGGQSTPDNIYMLENTPHDWLFPRVEACVIHGGAGTTAIALKSGLPTMVVPFFGDQNFWGSMIGTAGAGPEPVPYKSLTAQKLADGIKECLTDECKQEAQRIARSIEAEGDGALNAVRSFQAKLCSRNTDVRMQCSILKDRIAIWKSKDSDVRLSSLAAYILVSKGQLQWKRLRLVRHTEWNDFEGPGEPLTGAAESIVTSVGNFFGGIGSVPYKMAKTSQKHKEKREKKEARQAERKEKMLQLKHRKLQQRQQKQQEDLEEQSAKLQQRGQSTPATTSGGKKDVDSNEPLGSANLLGIPTPMDLPTGATTPGGLHAEEYFGDVTAGIGRSATALARAPVDLALALAQGFHNAPKIYGDDTVRRPKRVTGIKSGLRAAGSEFAYGVYDGFTGVVRLPYRGAKRGGAKGFAKGVGMGLTGFVLKDLAAIVGPFAYTLKGVAKQAGRHRQPNMVIRRARVVEGRKVLEALDIKGTVQGGATKKDAPKDLSARKAENEHFAGKTDNDGKAMKDDSPEGTAKANISNHHDNGSQHDLHSETPQIHDTPNGEESMDHYSSYARSRADVEREVVEGWNIFGQLLAAVEAEEKRDGIRGQVSALFRSGLPDAFLDVGVAKRTLESVREGKSLKDIFGVHNAEHKQEQQEQQELELDTHEQEKKQQVQEKKQQVQEKKQQEQEKKKTASVAK